MARGQRNVAPARSARLYWSMAKKSFTVSPDGQIVDDGPVFSGPSRSQKKREARALFELGQKLSGFGKAELARLPLEEELLEALLLTASMQRTARARQLRRINKLLRSADRTSLIQALRASGRLS